MRTSLAARLLAGPDGWPVVPLETAQGYRDATEGALSVSHVRYVACPACARKGCERCSAVGWLVEPTTTPVTIPHGATAGTRVTVEGAGDDVDGKERALVVEIVRPGPHADDLRAARADFEAKLETAWQMEATAHTRRRRRGRLLAAGAAVLLLLLPIGRWLTKASTGETCGSSADCRSGHCLRLVTAGGHPRAVERLDGRVCTSSCATDLDCPPSMECRTRGTGPGPSIALDVPDGLACIPHGY